MDLPEIEGYEVLGALGRGGMGSVWRARHLASGREVALKVLRAGLSGDSELALRFKREAAVLGGLNHPGIAEFIESTACGDVVCFAMEYIDGEALSERIADGALPVGEAVTIAAGVAEALAAAHAAGVIHRDVKPSNIILSASGAKLTDFGLARRLDGSALTTASRVMGSLPYMSPEQVRGKKLSGASDIYSLGVVLYEMLTAERPFDAADDAALATKILSQPPPLVSRQRKDAPVGLDLLLLGMLAKDVKLREKSAAEVAGKLREVAEVRGPGRTPAVRRHLSGEGAGDRFLATLAASACCAVIGALPALGAFDGVAGRLERGARSLIAAGGRQEPLLAGALARRRVKKARRELRVLEARRDERLRRAEAAVRGSRSEDTEERQSFERLRREMREEAEVFERRIGKLSEEVVEASELVRAAKEKARMRGKSRGKPRPT